MASPRVRASAYLPSLLGAACVACALVLSTPSIVDAQLARPTLITLLAGLAGLAVLAALLWSMGLAREPVALRWVAAVPILLSILVIAALMLDVDFRGRAGTLGR